MRGLVMRQEDATNPTQGRSFPTAAYQCGIFFLKLADLSPSSEVIADVGFVQAE